MTRQFIMAAALTCFAGTASAGEVAPKDVVFEDGAIAASLTGVPGNPEEGAKVISTRSLGNCVACHEISAMPTAQFQGNVGPSLDGAADRWSEAELRGMVANAKIMFEGTRMPAFYKVDGFIRPGVGYTREPATEPLPPILTGQQIEDVVAYLMTLKE
jgi:L-cysteine S-thiosulfotransferase